MRLVVWGMLGLGMLFGAFDLGAYLITSNADTRGVVGLMLLTAAGLFLASESKRLLFHQLSLRIYRLEEQLKDAQKGPMGVP